MDVSKSNGHSREPKGTALSLQPAVHECGHGPRPSGPVQLRRLMRARGAYDWFVGLLTVAFRDSEHTGHLRMSTKAHVALTQNHGIGKIGDQQNTDTQTVCSS